MIKPFAKMLSGVKNLQNSKIAAQVMSQTKTLKGVLGDQEKLLYKSISGRAIPAGYSSGGKRQTLLARMNSKVTPFSGGVAKWGGKVASGLLSSPASLSAQFAVGSVAMASISLMNGGLYKMDQIMQQRYMKDSRYSSQMLAQTNVGKSMGTGRLNLGNHAGLSLSMHKGRHG